MAKYKFSNKLMFALVMQDEVICAEFIQRLFPGKKVKSITFPNDIQITPEKTIVTGIFSKSVRLDVLFEGESEVYDIGRRVPRAKALHSWHETCLASTECFTLSIGGLGLQHADEQIPIT